MSKHRYRIVIFAGLLVWGCQNPSTDDPEALKAVLRKYFDGIKNADHDRMKSATTDDFLLYETGKIWNNDSVFVEMDRAPYQVEFSFDNFRVTMDKSSAHMAYQAHAHFAFDDTVKQDFDFIESAAFRKTGGQWKMMFLHVTEKTENNGN